MSLTGLVSQYTEEDVMVEDSGLSRGDKRRNAKLAALRELVPVDNAVFAIDLADHKQVAVLVDHDSRVLKRQRVKARAWQLGPVLDWAREQARKRGFADATIACEPTGHRWRVLDQLAAERDMTLVCVQPLLVGQARQTEDYTRDKTDDKDAVLIARLVTELHCYVPERPDEAWAELRHLGAYRDQLITTATTCRQQLRDLLECAWPAVLTAAAEPFDSITWCATLAAVLDCYDGHLERPAHRSYKRFEAAIRRELPRWGAKQGPCQRIAYAVYAALTDSAGVIAQRRGALRRARWVLADWHATKTRLAQVQDRMLAIIDELGLTQIAGTIPGVSVLGVASILAETGDPTRFTNPRALAKHAGLCPREDTSGTMTGRSRISRRGRPRLRLAAWRAVWGALSHNPVMAARYQHLTTREHNRLTPGQARAAIAAALLRQIHVITVQRTPWNAAIASAAKHPTAA
ncbi:hypothetical protein BKN37_27050 [Mycobacterium talmoniae]|uniref:Uncharacterized protein n=2 Tax=Mycobacterium talmoniae TaxID=1858794 RepID=A0A1S1MEZ6_9MYCO|nr:hypothetical protein BKN37_27050 [Mycobacterium talmoniae]